MALLESHSSDCYTPYISQINLFPAITGFGFHSCKVRGWHWVFTYLNHLMILISLRFIPVIAEHLCNNKSYSTERRKRYSALTGITCMTGPDVKLYSGNTSRTIQSSSSFMGAYLGCSLVGEHKVSRWEYKVIWFKTSMLLKAEMHIIAGSVPVLHLSQKSLWWSWKFLLYPGATYHYRSLEISWKYKGKSAMH